MALDRSELIKALTLDDFTPYYQMADEMRRRKKGNEVKIRAIIEISNICARYCTYCGLNAANAKVHRYRMPENEIIETARRAVSVGYKTIVLQSGEDPGLDIEEIGRIIRDIKAMGEIAVTLSLGELDEKEYRYFKECGADRYLLKHETSDPKLYGRLHPDSDLETRIENLRTIKRLGYETGSGFMIGLPGQTVESLADDLLLLKTLGCDMAGMGPFISHPDTPLRGNGHGDTEMTKRVVALARLLLPDANLPVTTALGVLSQKERLEAFSCGANVVMRKTTPDPYRKYYEIYPADIPSADIPGDRLALEKMLDEIGRKGV